MSLTPVSRTASRRLHFRILSEPVERRPEVPLEPSVGAVARERHLAGRHGTNRCIPNSLVGFWQSGRSPLDRIPNQRCSPSDRRRSPRASSICLRTVDSAIRRVRAASFVVTPTTRQSTAHRRRAVGIARNARSIPTASVASAAMSGDGTSSSRGRFPWRIRAEEAEGDPVDVARRVRAESDAAPVPERARRTPPGQCPRRSPGRPRQVRGSGRGAGSATCRARRSRRRCRRPFWRKPPAAPPVPGES